MLRKFRLRAGLSQVTVAKALGVTSQHYSRVESGSRKLWAEDLATLAKLLNLTHKEVGLIVADRTPERRAA